VRNIILYLVFISLGLFICNCSTGRGAILSNIGDGATEYRDISAEIRDEQAELGITGARIEERSRELEQSIREGAQEIQDITTIIRKVRQRPITPEHGTETKNNGYETGE